MTKAPILVASNLRLEYRAGTFRRFSHIALKDVSLELYPGETFGIFGRNGCGKSSLLRILAGIYAPTKGTIQCAPAIRRALLTLGLGFRDDLTGRDNTLFSLMLQGVTKSDAKRRLDAVHEFSELGEFFDQPLKTYSNGMRSRLGFAASMMVDLDILLIDETLSVGDRHFRSKAESAIHEKMASGLATIYVSHDFNQVKQICNRALWLDQGLVRADGQIAEVASAYNDYMDSLDASE